ncbi:MAG: linear amide C-N hydrolase [Oscillospiraceae bacterium]|nr:linear amide C-N hydrolase [Oscillospiraceae bacterium]
MCTAVSFKNKNALFGRNLDLDYHYSESVAVVPRNFPFAFKKNRFAIIGTAFVKNGFPLFYDGMNEKGLFAAGLNFPKSAVYFPEREGFLNVASFELIPWILSTCKNLSEAKEKLNQANVLNTNFEESLPATPLHWFFADKTGSIVAEPVESGLKIYENPAGVLTNEPPFPKHLENLGKIKGTVFAENLSSEERFAKAVFMKENCAFEKDFVTQFFKILESVGKTELKEKPEKTVYSSCADPENLVYYYKTYENGRISAVDMKKENLDGEKIISYPMVFENDIFFQN